MSYGTGRMTLSKRWIYLSAGLAVNAALLLLIPVENYVLRSVLVTFVSTFVICRYLYLRYCGRLALQSDLLVAVNTCVQFLLPVFFLAFFYKDYPDEDKFGFRYGYALTSFAILIAQTMFFAGYESIKPGIYFPRPRSGGGRYLPEFLTLLPLLLFVWISRLVLLAGGTYYHVYRVNFQTAPAFFIYSLLGDYGMIIIAFVFLTAFLTKESKTRKRMFLLAMFFLAVELIWYLPTGYREATAKIALIPVLAFIYVHGVVPKKTLAVLVIAGLLAFPVWGSYRNALPEYQQRSAINYGAVVPTFKDAAAMIKGPGGRVMIEHVVDRLYDGKFFGYLLRHFAEDYDWEMGATYQNIPFFIVPRFLYLEKPSYTMALRYQLVGAGSVPTTFWGEAFMNYSWWGLIFISFLFGLMLKGFDYIFIKHSRSIFWVCLYIYSAVNIMRYPVEPLGVWFNFFSKIIILAFVLTQFETILRYLLRRNLRPSGSDDAGQTGLSTEEVR